MYAKVAAFSTFLALVAGPQAGTQTTEPHPKMTWQKCSAQGSCTTVNGEVTIDANWRWVHDKGGYSNCYNGNKWNETICKDAKTCSSNCAVDGKPSCSWTLSWRMMQRLIRAQRCRLQGDVWCHHQRQRPDAAVRHQGPVRYVHASPKRLPMQRPY